MDAVGIDEDKGRELIRVRGLDPASQIAEVRRLVEDAVTDYDERCLLGQLPPLGALEHARRRVYDAVAGFGSRQPLLEDPAVEEVWINSPTEIHAARASRLEHLVELSLLTHHTASFLSRFLDGRAAAIGRGTPLADVTRAQLQDVRDLAKRELMECAGRKETAVMVPLVFGVLPLIVLFSRHCEATTAGAAMIPASGTGRRRKWKSQY